MKLYKILIIISSLAGLTYFITALYGRIRVTSAVSSFGPGSNNELKNILLDIPFIIPALSGFFYFIKKQFSKLSISSYLIYLISGLTGLYALLMTTDALEAGLTIMLFSLPLCILSIIILFVSYIKFRKSNS